MSSGFARIAGFGVQELRENIRTAEDYLARIYSGDRDRIRDFYNAPRKDSEGWEYEYRLHRPDGEIRWVREVGKVFQRTENAVEKVVGVIQDITGQKSIEEELRYKDALANQAEAITDIGHFVFDEIRQKYLYASPGFIRIFGKADKDFMAHYPASLGDVDLVHPDDRERVQKVYDKFSTGEKEWQVEYRLTHDNGGVRWIREMGAGASYESRHCRTNRWYRPGHY